MPSTFNNIPPCMSSMLVPFVLFLFISQICCSVRSTPLGNDCPNTTTYSPYSSYRSNLESLLATLSSNANGGKSYYNSTSGGEDGSEKIYGMFLGRGDVSEDECQDCMTGATAEIIQYCPKLKIAMVYYEHCFLRYSNQSTYPEPDPSIFTNPNKSSSYVLRNGCTINIEPHRFSQQLRDMMDEIATAIDHWGKRFLTKETNFTNEKTIYTLAQCIPDLSASDCLKCLKTVITKFPVCCYGRRGARIYYPSCNIRYEEYLFYKIKTVPVSPPAPSKNKGRVC
ncbi:cysteine-rich receptor-like protein kinase 25 [Lycium barbarum]|uniref:cysteine-rich receptor-like protein kinase 25 n=1 Tax=Lycium barbarum TaxID=112863 RepID=UPI00293EB169|nr:cysteine-rich receptor-like protein kinase 25 [Lycium barbarum]